MSTTVVELSVERLSGVLSVERVVARERGDPCSVRVCGGRQVEQQRNGHLQLDRQMPPTSTEPHGTSGSARLALSTCAEGRGELAWNLEVLSNGEQFGEQW